jgi:ubiquinone/menaquinone biosynthesis C-methylase UbiE
VILNRVEFALMNNPLRAAIQRYLEARRLLRLGGSAAGARALEIGCGRGVGTELILDMFRARSVDAFDLDPRMVALASRRLAPHGKHVRLWVGDATTIPVPDGTYDVVFDFAIIHHVPDWRRVLAEVHRVLRPGGRFFAEEVLRPFIDHPLSRRLLDHPRDDRFSAGQFQDALERAGLQVAAMNEMWSSMAWFVARKPASPLDGEPVR